MLMHLKGLLHTIQDFAKSGLCGIENIYFPQTNPRYIHNANFYNITLLVTVLRDKILNDL